MRVLIAVGAVAFGALALVARLVNRATSEFDKTVTTALRAAHQDPPLDPEAEHELWVLGLRRQAQLDALEGSIRRHPAGKRRGPGEAAR